MARQMMGTVDKALSLLRFFSPQIPELGLSELARQSGFDKATTLRCLTALERNGFVEQDVNTRQYRIGLSPFHLAQVREQSFPIESIIVAHLDALAESIGETAHGTVMAGKDPVTVAISYPNRALFVYVHPSSPLPWHATASGIAIAAFQSKDAQNELLDRLAFEPFTESTLSSRDEIKEAWKTCRSEGLARARLTFEDDVIGTAAPVFGQSGAAIGSLAIASVSLRMTNKLQKKIDAKLKEAAVATTKELGGISPRLTKPVQMEGR